MTTRDTILNLLRSGPKTSWELCQGAKTSRYGGRIFELRKMGYVIKFVTRMSIRGDRAVIQRIYRLVSEPAVPTPFRVKRAPKRGKVGLIDNGRAAEFKQGRLL